MPVFTRTIVVEIVRAAGTTKETRWSAEMGGDLATTALFYAADRVKTGDQIHNEIFDEPKVLTAVHPETSISGQLLNWKAEMMPLSRWERENRPAGTQVSVSGQGARVNLNSIDYSIQHFDNRRPQLAAVLQELDDVKAAIARLGSEEDRNDAAIDVRQIETELQRSRPEKAVIGKFIDRLNAISGVAERTTKLALLIAKLFD